METTAVGVLIKFWAGESRGMAAVWDAKKRTPKKVKQYCACWRSRSMTGTKMDFVRQKFFGKFYEHPIGVRNRLGQIT